MVHVRNLSPNLNRNTERIPSSLSKYDEDSNIRDCGVSDRILIRQFLYFEIVSKMKYPDAGWNQGIYMISISGFVTVVFIPLCFPVVSWYVHREYQATLSKAHHSNGL